MVRKSHPLVVDRRSSTLRLPGSIIGRLWNTGSPAFRGRRQLGIFPGISADRSDANFIDAFRRLCLASRTKHSEDMQHGRKFGGLTVVNPFIEGGR
jgi:hypothetical protein